MRKRTLRDAYGDHKRGARKRGISFELSFKEWLDLWQQSGHLQERGCHHGQYVMARPRDCGPYSINNVYITTCGTNCCEAHKGRKRSDKTRQRISAVRKGRPTRTGAVLTEETKRKISATKQGKPNTAWIGRKHTEATKLKISQAKKGVITRSGYKLSNETKQKIREAALKRYHLS